jgi:hypothetical protein
MATNTRDRAAPKFARPALNVYGEAVRQNLFYSPQPEVRKPVPVVLKPVHSNPAPPVPSVDPLSDTVYAGSMTIDGNTFALLESRSTKRGEYLGAGASWQGFKVVSITPQQVTLAVSGSDRMLAVSDAFNAVPLNASVPGGGPGGGPLAGAQAPGAVPQDGMAAQADSFASFGKAFSLQMLEGNIQLQEKRAMDDVKIQAGKEDIGARGN